MPWSANRARAFWGFDYYRTAELRSTGWPTRAMLAAVFAAEAGGCIVAARLALAGFVGVARRSSRSGRGGTICWWLAAAVLLYILYVFSFSVGRQTGSTTSR